MVRTDTEIFWFVFEYHSLITFNSFVVERFEMMNDQLIGNVGEFM